MFEMQAPWWEFVVRAAIVYLALLLMVRLTGKRTVGQFTPFDLIVVMLLSEGVSGALKGPDESIPGGLIVAVTLVLLDVGIALATARSRKVDEAMQGTPVLVGRDGKIYEDVLKRERVAVAEVEKALRGADCELKDMRLAILEADGNINIMTKKG